jgi:hypothetical protein
MSVWWEERAALLEHAVAMIAVQAECSLDAALLLLKLRARAEDGDLEEIAAAVMEGGTSFSPECPSPQMPPPARTETGGTRRRA